MRLCTSESHEIPTIAQNAYMLKFANGKIIYYRFFFSFSRSHAHILVAPIWVLRDQPPGNHLSKDGGYLREFLFPLNFPVGYIVRCFLVIFIGIFLPFRLSGFSCDSHAARL